MELLQGHERVQRTLLLRPQAEAAEPAVRKHAGEDQPHGPQHRVGILFAHQRFTWHVAPAAEAQQDRVADLGVQLAPQRLVHDDRRKDLADLALEVQGLRSEHVRESLVDAVDADARCARSGVGVGHGTAKHDGRGGGAEVRCDLIPKEPIQHQGGIDPAQSIQCQVSQTAPYRIADQQRACQHGGGHRCADGHGQVDAPVVD